MSASSTRRAAGAGSDAGLPTTGVASPRAPSAARAAAPAVLGEVGNPGPWVGPPNENGNLTSKNGDFTNKNGDLTNTWMFFVFFLMLAMFVICVLD